MMAQMAQEINNVKADSEEMVNKIVPEMKIKVSFFTVSILKNVLTPSVQVGELLRKHHASLAEKMTTAPLTQL